MKHKILFVDDEEAILRVLTKAFDRVGYEVHCATNGEEAMEIAKQEKIEVFFVDMQMPGMSGIELCNQIREKVIFYCMYAMTGHATLYDVRKCRVAGCDDYFKKPFDIQTLTKAADHAFEKLARWKTTRKPGCTEI